MNKAFVHRLAGRCAAGGALVAALVCTFPVAAQGSAPTGPADATEALQATVDRVVGRHAQDEAIPGLVVGISWRGQRSFFGYSGTGQPAYGADTIVEIGSITKVFTTALFAEAVLEGRVQRDATLRSLMPDAALGPCTGQITLLQLADFSSGMPTLPGDVPRGLDRRGIDSYTADDFLRWVSRWQPDDGNACGSPAPYRYSNASVGLLGVLLAGRLGQPWSTLVQQRITGPLGMRSTAIEPPPGQSGRVAAGYGKQGQPVVPWPVFAWYAAGALRSTAADMLAFGEAALGHATVNGNAVPPVLLRALQDAMRPIYQPEGQVFEQGMAWMENVGDADGGQRPVFLKAGGTDGFNSVIVVNPAKDLAIFIAASRPKSNIPKLGVELSRQLRGAAR